MDKRKAKTPSYRDWVRDSLSNLGEYLNLGEWQLTVEYELDPQEPGTDSPYASISVDSDYLRARMTISQTGEHDFNDGNIDRLKEALTHEMVHILMAPFMDLLEPSLSQFTRPFAMKTLEQQTQKVTRVLLKTLPDYIFPPR